MEIGKDEKPRKHKNIYIYICKQKGIRFPIVKKKKTTEKGTIMREEYSQHKSNRHRLTCDPFGSLLCHAFSSFCAFSMEVL